MRPRIQAGSLVLWSLTLAVGAPAQDSDADFFEKKVRPLLAGRCFTCHSAASKPVMGGLLLDSREALEKGGSRGPAIVEAKPAESLLLKAVRHTEGNLKMPPGPKLSDAEIAILAEWVNRGAPWGAGQAIKSTSTGPFWAFVPPAEPPVPAVKNSQWAKSPIDSFVLAALESKGLEPAPPADKRTLIRRVTFDLTGLPPTPAEVRAFLEDSSLDAFSRVVERLLASPRYGERWGRHWLDVARYADSNGLDENLVYKNAFRYRDYVIQAFNKDKPYDQFIREQLAGDLITASDPATRYESWTATGFLALGAKMLAEDDPVKMEMDIIDEQLDTAARTFMGLTIGCARCHDHKFDPIPTADYYAMAGIFKSSQTMDNFKVVARWHEYVLAPEKDRERLKAHQDRIEAKRKEIGRISRIENEKLIAEARTKVGSYLLACADVDRYEAIRIKPVLSGAEDSPGPGMIVRNAGEFDAGNVPRKLERKQKNVAPKQRGPFFAEYRIVVPAAGEYQIDFQDEERGGGTADLWINGALVKRGAEPVENRAASPDTSGWTVAGTFPLAQGKNTLRLEHKSRFPYFARILIAASPLRPGEVIPRTIVQVAREHGINSGFLEQWVDHLKRSRGAPHSLFFKWLTFGQPVRDGEWTSPAASLISDSHAHDRQRLAARYQELFIEALKQWEALPEERRKQKDAALADPALDEVRKEIFEKFGPLRAPGDSRQYFRESLRQQLSRMDDEVRELETETPQFPRAMGIREASKIVDLPIHIRGSHWTPGEVTPRGFLSAISVSNPPPLPKNQSGRLQLADWLVSKDHPLTSRVMANRIWRWHFGKGIVPSTDNFGRLGEQPTNQPLLDWLARRFIESGWSIKQMHRLILLSNTYQMSSRFDARSAEIDPENAFLWRANRRRLEAEAIRDAIMAVSGDLQFTAGGSILDYKDRQYVSDTEKRGAIDYERSIRSVYLPVIRSAMFEVFQAFDLPDPAVANGDRDSTVVAPQALFMMNGAAMLKHSRILAEDLLTRTGIDDNARIVDAYERAFGRPPTPAEIDRALTFIARVENATGTNTSDTGERRLLAWQSFAKSLMSANEFIYVN